MCHAPCFRLGYRKQRAQRETQIQLSKVEVARGSPWRGFAEDRIESVRVNGYFPCGDLGQMASPPDAQFPHV